MAGMFGSTTMKSATVLASNKAASRQNLNKVYKWYTGGFLAFVVVLAVLEQLGMSTAAG